MTVTCVKDAWTEADKIFPTDYERDTERTERAGYPVYCSTTAESTEGLAAISQERKDLVLRLRRATFAYTREYLNYLDKKEQEEIACNIDK